MSNKKIILTEMNISQWLGKKGFGEYTKLFLDNEVTLKDLSEIATHEDLKEIGISSFMKRKKLLSAIAAHFSRGDGNSIKQTISTSSSLQLFDEQEQRIIEQYPYMIAYPFHEMLSEKNAFIKINLLKDVFLNVLKYLSFIAATEYLNCNKRSLEIDKIFEEKLQQPQFGLWNEFIKSILLYLKNINHRFIIPELLSSYTKLEMGKGKKTKKYKIEIQYTDEYGDRQFNDLSSTAILALVNFRNRYIGHNMVLKPEKSEAIFNLYYPILLDILEQIHFCSDYPLKSQSQAGSVYWIGTKPIVKSESNDVTKKLIFLETKNEKLWIPELFLLHQKINTENKLYLYEKINGNRIVFVGVKCEVLEIPAHKFEYIELIKGQNNEN